MTTPSATSLAFGVVFTLGCGPDPLAVGHVWLEDVTSEAGLAFDRTPAEGYATLADRMSGGVCVLDADGAAPLDLFFAIRPAGTETRSRLFIARGPLEYADQTLGRGLSDVGDAVGCLAFDADGDGDDDLLVTGVGSLRLFLREGGTFIDASDSLDVTVGSADVLTSAAAGDLDGDGDLDLVVAGFVDASSARPGDCGGISCSVILTEITAVSNHVLLREGARFVERTPEIAPDLARAEPTLAVAIVDLDADGRPDIFVGNDAGAFHRDRFLVRNIGGVFVDEALLRGLATDAGGNGIDTMGVAIGDVNGDGHLDLTETSFSGFHSALFLCGADHFCEERGRALGLRSVEPSLRWGNALVDLDLDGDLDLFEATGHVYLESEGALRDLTFTHDQRPNLLVGRGDGSFVLVIPEPDDALDAGRWPARGLAIADLDDDGRPDIVLGTTRGSPALLRNVRRPDGLWLRVVLRGRPPNTGAVGARVEVSDGRSTRVRMRLAGEGYLGSHDPRLLFGLPSAASEVEVRVRWPSGATSVTSASSSSEIVIDEP